jgi:hypothetical protein
MIADDVVALAMGVMDGRDEVPDFEVAGVVAGVKEVLEDFKIWDWLSVTVLQKTRLWEIGDGRRKLIVELEIH